jgi:hypothetical protein
MFIVVGYDLRKLADANVNAPSVPYEDLTEPGHIYKNTSSGCEKYLKNTVFWQILGILLLAFD